MDSSPQPSPRVLLAITDLRFRRSIENTIRSAGFITSAPSDAEAACVLAESFSPDIIVIDGAMRDADDRLLFGELRKHSDGYILCVDATGRERTRIEMFRLGADDVVSAPVSSHEIKVRCQALMRRPREMQEQWVQTTPTAITIGPLTVDSNLHEASLDGTVLALTPIEFSLLEHLTRRPSEVSSRPDLLDSVWGPNWVGDTHVVDVHLSNLRRKLGEVSPSLNVIQTVRGVGFRISNDLLTLAECRPITELALAPDLSAAV